MLLKCFIYFIFLNEANRKFKIICDSHLWLALYYCLEVLFYMYKNNIYSML